MSDICECGHPRRHHWTHCIGVVCVGSAECSCKKFEAVDDPALALEIGEAATGISPWDLIDLDRGWHDEAPQDIGNAILERFDVRRKA